MELVIRPRKAGKTETLIDWVKQGEKTHRFPFWTRVVVVPRLSDRREIVGKGRLDPYQAFTYDEWAKEAQTASQCEVGIDNADNLLRMLVRAPVSMASFTRERRPDPGQMQFPPDQYYPVLPTG